MSGARRELTGDVLADVVEPLSPFARGARVGVEQMGVVAGSLGSHSMGHGDLVEAPQVGSLLELRIRGARGLASSRIQALRIPAESYMLVATERSVYLVTLPELRNRSRPDIVTRAAIEMVDEVQAGEACGVDVTQYVRLELDAGRDASVLPCGPVFASVERVGEAASKEELGQCELLSPVAMAAPLRFSTADGRVLATSDVASISECNPGEFVVSTGNSIYLLVPILSAKA